MYWTSIEAFPNQLHPRELCNLYTFITTQISVPMGNLLTCFPESGIFVFLHWRVTRSTKFRKIVSSLKATMASAEHDSILASTSYVPPSYFKWSLDFSIFYKVEVLMASSILLMLLLASFGTSQSNQTILFYYDTYCQEFARDAITESNTCNLNAWSDVHSASYNFTCGADYYVAFAVYDSSNVSLCKHFCCHCFSISG
jgi:hypothetical protein